MNKGLQDCPWKSMPLIPALWRQRLVVKGFIKIYTAQGITDSNQIIYYGASQKNKG